VGQDAVAQARAGGVPAGTVASVSGVCGGEAEILGHRRGRGVPLDVDVDLGDHQQLGSAHRLAVHPPPADHPDPRGPGVLRTGGAPERALRAADPPAGPAVPPTTAAPIAAITSRSARPPASRYTRPPPITQIRGVPASSGPAASRSARCAAPSASSRLRVRTAPGAVKESSRVMTMLVRPGRGRYFGGKDSQVRLPITTGDPVVVREKCLRSSGRCQGMVPPDPITPPRAWAQIMPIRGVC